IQRKRVIVPTVFERCGGACLAACVRWAWVSLGNEVGDPSLLHVFGKVASGAVRIHRILAQILVSASPVELEPAFPIAEIHEDSVITMEGGLHVAVLACRI